MKDNDRSAPQGLRSRVAAFLIAATIWLSLISFPHNPPAAGVDPSWQQALAQAAKNRLQAGVDYVFTYGPLGYHMDSIDSGYASHFLTHYDSALFTSMVAWELVVNLFLTVVFMRFVRHIERPWERAVLVLGVVLFAAVSKDALYLVGIVAVTIHAIEGGSRRVGRTLVMLVFLASVALMKFTFFALAALCAGGIVAAFALERSLRGALAAAISFPVLLALAWMSTGQSLGNLPAYIRLSAQMAARYSEAMALPGSGNQVILALGMLALVAALLLMTLVARPFKASRLAAAAAVAAGFFMAWKAGFIRHDLHSFVFFAFAAPAPYLLERPAAARRLVRAALACCALAVSVGGALGALRAGQSMHFVPSTFVGVWNTRVVANVEALVAPAATKARLDEELADLEDSNTLDKVTSIVKDGSIDLVGDDQELLFLNRLSWRGRPAFQSYSAYTPTLLSMNAEFFSGPKAPDYVMLGLYPIDDWYAATQDCEALEVVIRNYQPLLVEGGYILLKRNALPRPAAKTEPAIERTISFGEAVDLSRVKGDCQMLSLDIRYSWLGRLANFFYKAPAVYLRVRTEKGVYHEMRIVPGVAKSGFIINPLLRRQSDLIRWYNGTATERVVFFELIREPKALPYYDGAISVTVTPSDLKPMAPPQALDVQEVAPEAAAQGR